MTKYRTIHDGYCEWLQYLTTVDVGWWIFRRQVEKWGYIRSEYYDYVDEKWEQWEKTYGFSSNVRNHRRFINSSNTNLLAFIKKYPNINKWFDYQSESVKKQREQAYDHQRQIELRKGATKYFNS